MKGIEAYVESKQELATVVMAGFDATYRKVLKRAKLENKTLIIERDGKPVRVKACDL